MAIVLIIAVIVVTMALLVGMDSLTRRRRPERRIERTRKWRRDAGGPE